LLRDLRVGRTVEIALDKAGYTTVSRRIEVLPGEARHELFRLIESSGTVRLTGVPAGATVYVDDAPADGHRPLILSVGPHRLRVEGSEDVLFSATISVRPGEQKFEVRAGPQGGQGKSR
jgi:hypothetical protein